MKKLNKKTVIKIIDIAIQYQNPIFERRKQTYGNCTALYQAQSRVLGRSYEFRHYLPNLFTELFKPKLNKKSPLFFMELSLDGKSLSAEQIYDDRIAALLFFKEYIKQHGVEHEQ